MKILTSKNSYNWLRSIITSSLTDRYQQLRNIIINSGGNIEKLKSELGSVGIEFSGSTINYNTFTEYISTEQKTISTNKEELKNQFNQAINSIVSLDFKQLDYILNIPY